MTYELKVSRTMAHLWNENNFIGISFPYKTEKEKNIADFIVHATNNHNPLLATLIETQQSIESGDISEYYPSLGLSIIEVINNAIKVRS